MANRVPFGRRGDLRPPLGRSAVPIEKVAPRKKVETTGLSVERPVLLLEDAKLPSLDDELRQWKLARRQNFQIPWRSLYLMATLCFGLASFVLPDSINDEVEWLLYALAAASLYVWFRGGRRQAKS
jgi:hypothetical protein